MIVDLAIAMVVGIRTDSFMYMDIDMSMFIRSKIRFIGLKKMASLVQQLSKIDLKIVQHGAKMGFRTVY